MQNRSALKRDEIIKTLKDETFDLLVVGGGVTGSGIALDAAARGLSVALIEKNDFASGTSSKSTKLIHGGLRYLKQFEIGLVRETGQERAIVHQLAPHLVRPRKMLLPLIEGGTYGRLATSFGLRVYDFLADVEKPDRRVMLNTAETKEKEPLLQTKGLLGSGYYAEYQTDDARLTIDLALTAIQHGANCLNYCKAESFIYQEDKVCGVTATDSLGSNQFEIKAKYVVSATGPWVDEVRTNDQKIEGKRLFLSKGVHIVVPHERLPLKQAVYFDVPDGRMLFAIPRLKVTYIGTTDTPYHGDPNDVRTNSEDVAYLLEGTNGMFPEANLKEEDVESSWAGLRPLIYEPGKKASEMSRKDEIFESDRGLISIAGGKLTGYRKMAERVVDLIASKLPSDTSEQLAPCNTRKIQLNGGPFADAAAVSNFEQELETQITSKGLDPYRAAYLTGNYGKNSVRVLEYMDRFEGSPESQLVRAELAYCVQHELCFLPDDFFNRRTGRLYFDIQSIPEVMNDVLEDFAEYFSWTEEQTDSYRKQLSEELKKHSEFANA